MKYFDSYPQFYETTMTKRLPNRLHQRWLMICDRNKHLFEGARVLDLGSHDGRWAFAALEAGAASVVGVEEREELVSRSYDNFELYGVGKDRFDFVRCDVIDYLAAVKGKEKFDLVLNLGFFYHTIKHLQILEECVRPPSSLIKSASLSNSERPIRLRALIPTTFGPCP